MSETWLPVVDYEGLYEVSDRGCVKSLERRVQCREGMRVVRERILKLNLQDTGYHTAVLCREGHKKTRSVHTLVLESFIGPRPAGAVACHNDGNRTNNWPGNLRWDSQSNNLYDTVRHGNNRLAAAKECKRAHEFSAENTYTDPKGWRRCRQCMREGRAAREAG